jgi:hypothetical protein
VARRHFSFRGSQALGLVVAVPAFLGAALLGLLYLHDPPGRDQGVFAYIGWRWLNGEIPYLNAGLEHKGPLPFAAYATALALFGHSVSAIRLLAWISTCAAGVLVTWIATRITGRVLAGVMAGAAYLLFVSVSGLGGYWNGAETEAFMEPFTAASIVCALIAAGQPLSSRQRNRPPRRLPWWFAAGCFLGMASLGKPTALAVAVALVAALPVFDPWMIAALGAGILGPWLGALGFFAQRGAAWPFIDQVFLYNLAYGGEGFHNLGGLFTDFPHSFMRLLDLRLLALILPGAWVAMTSFRQPAYRLAFLWAVCAFAEVIAQGRFWLYHFYPVMAPLAVCFGMGVSALGAVMFVAGSPRQAVGSRIIPASPWLRALAALAIGIGLAGFGGLDWREAHYRYRYAIGDVPEAQFLAHFSPKHGTSDVDPTETLQAATWAQENLGADETLLMWGFEPAVNFLAERRSPTRFIANYYLTSESFTPEMRTRAWQQFWEDLSQDPPDWIAIVHNDRSVIEPTDSVAELEHSPDFKAFAERNFRHEVMIGDFEFLRRDADPASLKAFAAERAAAISALDPSSLAPGGTEPPPAAASAFPLPNADVTRRGSTR